MAGYKPLIKPTAAQEIQAIGSKRDRQRLVKQMTALSTNPRPSGCEKLPGVEGRFRLRQGQYRMSYAIDHARREIEIIKLGRRNEVHRNGGESGEPGVA